jgi:hypothetical protein
MSSEAFEKWFFRGDTDLSYERLSYVDRAEYAEMNSAWEASRQQAISETLEKVRSVLAKKDEEMAAQGDELSIEVALWEIDQIEQQLTKDSHE